jgi:hypothetical protein
MAAGLRAGRSLNQYQHGPSINVDTEGQRGKTPVAGLRQGIGK